MDVLYKAEATRICPRTHQYLMTVLQPFRAPNQAHSTGVTQLAKGKLNNCELYVAARAVCYTEAPAAPPKAWVIPDAGLPQMPASLCSAAHYLECLSRVAHSPSEATRNQLSLGFVWKRRLVVAGSHAQTDEHLR